MLAALSFLAVAAGGALHVGILNDPVSLEPYRASDIVSAAIVENVCDTLVRQRAGDARPTAGLATTWASRDGRTWTFTLREGVRFHDGTAFDADAVVANFEWLRRHHGFPGRALRAGPHVVAIRLERPNAALLATLSQPFFALQSPARLVEGDSGRAVGTGPFRLASVRPGRIELVANPDYWGGPPRVERVVFRRFADEHALVEALVSGTVDVTSALTQEEAEAVRARPDLRLDTRTGLNIAFLSVNHEHRPFGDRRVRQALARAIDREALVATTLGGLGEPAHNPLPPGLWGYSRTTRALVLDRAEARRLLVQAGLPDGFETTLLTQDARRPYLPAPLELTRRLVADLAEVGVRARPIRADSWAEYVERGSRGDYDMAVYGWQADTTDPNDFLTALLASEAIGSTNRSRYASPEMDSLLKRARRIAHPSERIGLYHAAQDLFQRELPWIPLYHVAVFTAYRSEIEGLTVGPTGLLRYDRVSRTPPPR